MVSVVSTRFERHESESDRRVVWVSNCALLFFRKLTLDAQRRCEVRADLVRSVQKGFKEPGVPAVLRYMVVLGPNLELTPNFGLTPKFGLQTSLGLVWALNMD